MAWLNSSAKGNPQPRGLCVQYDMPFINYCVYIADLAVEFGLKTEWSELHAWNDLTKSNLNRFECKAIHLMSVTYKSKYSEYNDTDLPRPYLGNSRQSSESIKLALRRK